MVVPLCMKAIKNILFDLDGTIIEPQEGIINSILYSLHAMGIEEPNEEELKSFIGPPLIDSFVTRYSLTIEEASKAVDLYRVYFSFEGLYQSTLYTGIVELLTTLYQKGFKLFIATSKPTVFAHRILLHFNISDLFEGIIGSNLDNTRKDKSDVIAFAIEQFHLNRDETIMVGDRIYDIIGARNNSLVSIGVTYGHGGIKELQDAGANHIVETVRTLSSLLLDFDVPLQRR